MPQDDHCPLCYSSLDTRVVAPCFNCGASEVELDHFRRGVHKYHELEVLPGHRLVLCDFCMVDFGSYSPVFFGLPRDARIGYESMVHIRALDPGTLGRDKFCSQCGYRLKFLKFVLAVRAQAPS